MAFPFSIMVSNHRSTLPSQAGWYFIPLLHPLFLCLLKRTNFSFTLLCSLLPHPVVCWFSPARFYYTPNSGFQLHLHSLCPILVISNFPPNRSDKVAPSPLQDLLIHRTKGPSTTVLLKANCDEQEPYSNFSRPALHLTAEI